MTRAKQCTRSVPTLTYMSTSCVQPPSPSRNPSFSLSHCPYLFLTPSRYLSPQYPLQRCTFQPIAYRVRLQCRSALAPLYPDDTPAPNHRPRPTTSLSRSLSLFLSVSPGLPAGNGAIDALHRVMKLETERKVLEYSELLPSFLMHPRKVCDVVSHQAILFFLPLPVYTRGNRLFRKCD